MTNIAVIPPAEISLSPEGWKNTFLYKSIGGYDEETDTYWGVITEFSDWTEVDYFLFINFYTWGYDIVERLNNLHLLDRILYYMLEPETVLYFHSKKYVPLIRKFCDCIFTWNKKLVDNTHVFHLMTYSWQCREDGISDAISSEEEFRSKKLLCNISSKKTSCCPNELYSERKKVIDWYDKNHCDDFDLYGFGWAKSDSRTFCGEVKYKREIYKKYKFAVAFENTKDVPGGVFEKLLDCLQFGVVPIYYGAPDILDYASKDCFIDYRDFESLEELHGFISSMSWDEYRSYILARNRWIEEKKYKVFTTREWGKHILDAAGKVEHRGDHVSRVWMLYLKFLCKCPIGRKAASVKTKLLAMKRAN